MPSLLYSLLPALQNRIAARQERMYQMSILNVENLTHGFGDRAIFTDVSFRLLKGEHIGLIGANGEGKSTFMNIITGSLTPDEGKVEWAKNVRTGYLDQHTALQKGMTVKYLHPPLTFCLNWKTR